MQGAWPRPGETRRPRDSGARILGPLSAIRAPLVTQSPGCPFPSGGCPPAQGSAVPSTQRSLRRAQSITKCLRATSGEIIPERLCSRLSSLKLDRVADQPGSAHSKHRSSRPCRGRPGPCRSPTPGFPGPALIGPDVHRPVNMEPRGRQLLEQGAHRGTPRTDGLMLPTS